MLGYTRLTAIVAIVLFIQLSHLSILARAQDATCSDDKPCDNGCCSNAGHCGFGPTYCGSGNCTSNCDAVAECGQYAPEGSFDCPLNVCCSEHGFCGTTSDFCGDGCQSGCDKVERPSCSGSSASKRTIGYYESWAYNRKCDKVNPESISANLWTHLNYAFALIDPNTFEMAQMNSFDVQLYTRFTDLKISNPRLKTYISVGGWDAGGEVFSQMVASPETRLAFIESALIFCRTYAFDGIDMDWEYPAAADRGSVEEDFENFVTFMKEFKQALGNLGLTVTLPSSYWYLKGFDIVSLEPYVDWFNVMSYDIHGTWDGNNTIWTSKVVNPHTNLTEINDALDLLWRNNINPSKVVMGLGFYGRSFTLADPSCKKPGCAFSGGGKKGECTDTSGVLSNAEIQRIISDNDLEPVLDEQATVKYMTWDTDQWVSYDDADTFKMKTDFANKLCLGGTMVWALDLDSSDSSSGQYLVSGGTLSTTNGFSLARVQAQRQQDIAGKLAYWTPCMSKDEIKCPGGYHQILTGHGKVYDSDNFQVAAGCHGSKNRYLCLNNEVIADDCHWNRRPGGSKICNSACPVGTIFLTQNTHPGGDKTDCGHGTYISVCCQGLTMTSDVCEDEYTADFIFSGGLKDSANAFNQMINVASSGEDSNGYDPSQPCKAPEYNFPQVPTGLGYIAVYGQDYLYCGGGNTLSVWPTNGPRRTVTKTENPPAKTRRTETVTKTCSGNRYPQPCAHYSSIQARNPWIGDPFCPDEDWEDIDPSNRIDVQRWYDQHNAEWRQYVPLRYKAPSGEKKAINCQADEWPPLNIWRSRPGMPPFVRYLPGGQNAGVANNADSAIRFDRDCAPLPLHTHTDIETVRIDVGVLIDTVVVREHHTWTVNRISMSFTNMENDPNDVHALTKNPCWPNALNVGQRNNIVGPGFALFNNDPYYKRLDNTELMLVPEYEQPLANTPYNIYVLGTPDWWPIDQSEPPSKRMISGEINFIAARDDGNRSHPLSEEEPTEHAAELGLKRCADDNCKEEIAEVQRERGARRETRSMVRSALAAGGDFDRHMAALSDERSPAHGTKVEVLTAASDDGIGTALSTKTPSTATTIPRVTPPTSPHITGIITMTTLVLP